MLPEVLELFAFGIAVHEPNGRLIYANRAAAAYLDDPVVVRVRSAAEKERGALAYRDDLQVCSIATGAVVVTFVANGQLPDVAASALLCEFTVTERRIAQLVTQGLTARQIATRLHISLYTVQSHFKSIFTKTHTKSQNELIARLRGPLSFVEIADFFAAAPSIRGCVHSSKYLSSPTVQNSNRGENS